VGGQKQDEHLLDQGRQWRKERIPKGVWSLKHIGGKWQDKGSRK